MDKSTSAHSVRIQHPNSLDQLPSYSMAARRDFFLRILKEYPYLIRRLHGLQAQPVVDTADGDTAADNGLLVRPLRKWASHCALLTGAATVLCAGDKFILDSIAQVSLTASTPASPTP